MAKRVLITGAGGFIGSFIVENALKRDYEVWAGVRASTSREFLTDERIHFIELDFSNPEKLEEALRTEAEKGGRWDYVVHNLGATKCAHYADFNRINYEYLRLMVETLKQLDIVPDGFLYMSSMSVLGEGDERHYTPFTGKEIPTPGTRYGLSKLKAETFLQMQPDFPYVILRPTGVYGPRDKDYYLMLKTLTKGFGVMAGFRPQMLTYLYADDLARTVFDVLESGCRRKSYVIADDKAYSQKQYCAIASRLLGRRFFVPLYIPLALLRTVCFFSEKIALLRGRTSTLNTDKYKILRQRNWTCSAAEAKKDFGFHTDYTLEQGLQASIDWYRAKGML